MSSKSSRSPRPSRPSWNVGHERLVRMLLFRNYSFFGMFPFKWLWPWPWPRPRPGFEFEAEAEAEAELDEFSSRIHLFFFEFHNI
jgi:hypothetical protein